MKVYQCNSRFFCTPLKRYIPSGALIARYENVTRLVLVEAPSSDKDIIFNILSDGFVYEYPQEVTWFYIIEPPNTAQFTLVSTKDEDDYGNVGGTSDGLPAGSKLKIYNNIPYLWNPTTNKWYAFRVSGPDGNVTLDIEQVGIVLP